LFGSAGSTGCEWGRMENMCFYGLVDKFGLVDKYLLLLLMKRKRMWEEKNVCNERKGKCFSVLFKRKTLSFVKVMFSMLTRIQFSLTTFLYCYQTWKNKKSEFQEFTFLQSNTALAPPRKPSSPPKCTASFTFSGSPGLNLWAATLCSSTPSRLRPIADIVHLLSHEVP